MTETLSETMNTIQAPLFIGTKVISAEPMTRGEYNIFRGWTLPANENGDDPGYLVEYLDGGEPNVPGRQGYVSWSPATQFENAYKPTTEVGFDKALFWLKHVNPLGAIQRQGWNGKGLVVKFVPGGQNPGFITKLPHLAMVYPPFNAELGLGSPLYPVGCEVPWLASQTDMLADDWTIVG